MFSNFIVHKMSISFKNTIICKNAIHVLQACQHSSLESSPEIQKTVQFIMLVTDMSCGLELGVTDSSQM